MSSSQKTTASSRPSRSSKREDRLEQPPLRLAAEPPLGLAAPILAGILGRVAELGGEPGELGPRRSRKVVERRVSVARERAASRRRAGRRGARRRRARCTRRRSRERRALRPGAGTRSRSRDLPTPDSPARKTSRGRPSRASASAASSSASSGARPMKLAALTRSTVIKVTLSHRDRHLRPAPEPRSVAAPLARCALEVGVAAEYDRCVECGGLHDLAPFDCLTIQGTRKEKGRQWANGHTSRRPTPYPVRGDPLRARSSPEREGTGLILSPGYRPCRDVSGCRLSPGYRPS